MRIWWQFSFSIPQNIFVGAGSLHKLPVLAKQLSKKKAYIISGPHLNKLGMVEKATEDFLSCGADFIVAFGGGSPIDVAKAVAVLATFGGKITDYKGAGKVIGPVVPIIAILAPMLIRTVPQKTAAACGMDAMKSGNILVNPRRTTKNDILDLYHQAF